MVMVVGEEGVVAMTSLRDRRFKFNRGRVLWISHVDCCVWHPAFES
jgi:hypothetical protein